MPLRPTSALRSATRTRTSTTFTKSPFLLPRASPYLPLPPTPTSSTHLTHRTHRTHRFYSTPMAAPTDTAAVESAAATDTIITPSSLKTILESKLNTTHVAVEDMSGGCGQAFNAIIVSSDFDKKSHLQRHRLVNNALKAEIAAIHAWTPRCLTPEQWEKEQGKVA